MSPRASTKRYGCHMRRLLPAIKTATAVPALGTAPKDIDLHVSGEKESIQPDCAYRTVQAGVLARAIGNERGALRTAYLSADRKAHFLVRRMSHTGQGCAPPLARSPCNR